MAARTPWTDAIARAVGTDWTPVEAVLEVGMRAVSPGRALQARERINSHQRGHARRPVSDEAAIRTGARYLAREALTGLVRRGAIERNGDHVRRSAITSGAARF